MKLELEKYEDKARWVLKGRIASHSATCSAAAGKRQIQDQKETNTGSKREKYGIKKRQIQDQKERNTGQIEFLLYILD